MLDPRNIWRGLTPFYIAGLGGVLGLAYGWHFAMSAQTADGEGHPELLDAGRCVFDVAGVCFVYPSGANASPIFGFAEFVTALALLIVLYTVSDVRFRFRVAVAPLPLTRVTFVCLAMIGLLTLLSDAWFSERWPIPSILANQSLWQVGLGGAFLFLVLLWVYFGFVNPPTFGRHNALRYASELYRHILKGVDTDLPVIAEELSRSAESIIRITKRLPVSHGDEEDENKPPKAVKPSPSVYAYDLLLLIGDRRFCRHIVAKAPGTAIRFFEVVTELQKYNIPIGQFAKNISTEALQNKDSIIYHESDGFTSGYFGYVQPFSNAVYGDYNLISDLGTRALSPFDIDYRVSASWDAEILEAYARALMLAFESYLQGGQYWRHPGTLVRAFNFMSDACRGLYKLDGVSTDFFQAEEYRKLDVAVDFFRNAVEVMERHNIQRRAPLRRSEEVSPIGTDFYDTIANRLFNIIGYAISVKGPQETCWAVQHNAIWGPVFSITANSSAWKIVQFKLRRLLYDEIVQLESAPNFLSAGILGYCLRMMGVSERKKGGFGKEFYPLSKAVVSWTQRNFLQFQKKYPHIAEECFVGGVSFDEGRSLLIRTYAKGLEPEPQRKILKLLD